MFVGLDVTIGLVGRAGFAEGTAGLFLVRGGGLGRLASFLLSSSEEEDSSTMISSVGFLPAATE